MRIDRYFIVSAVISFHFMSGSNLVLGISVAKFLKLSMTETKKKQPRSLTLTERLWFGPTGCSKSFTSAVRVPGCHVCYPVARDMLSLRSLISPSASQLPPSKSASDFLISSFFTHIDFLKNFWPSAPVWGQQNHPFHYPSPFFHMSDVNKRGRDQFQSMHW